MSGRLPLDPAAIQALVDLGDGPAFAIEVIDLFLADAPGQLDAVRDGTARRDARVLRDAAHALKSAAANLGLQEVSACAKALEAAARAGDLDAVAVPLDRLVQALAAAVHALDRERQRLGAG